MRFIIVLIMFLIASPASAQVTKVSDSEYKKEVTVDISITESLLETYKLQLGEFTFHRDNLEAKMQEVSDIIGQLEQEILDAETAGVIKTKGN